MVGKDFIPDSKLGITKFMGFRDEEFSKVRGMILWSLVLFNQILSL